LKLETKSLEVLGEALETLEAGFAELPALDPEADLPRLREVLREVAGKMRDNFPYFHPYYAGQMLKPPHPVARLAYMLALWINPNNHAFDGGRASSFMEKEAVAENTRVKANAAPAVFKASASIVYIVDEDGATAEIGRAHV